MAAAPLADRLERALQRVAIGLGQEARGPQRVLVQIGRGSNRRAAQQRAAELGECPRLTMQVRQSGGDADVGREDKLIAYAVHAPPSINRRTAPRSGSS